MPQPPSPNPLRPSGERILGAVSSAGRMMREALRGAKGAVEKVEIGDG